MGRQYFCDYCQRSFPDDIDSRKKHLNGVFHLRQKKEYYAVNRDLKTLVSEERSKEVCRRYRNTGDCPFGLLCNYTHYSEEELSSYERTVKLEEQKLAQIPNIEDWLLKSDRRRENPVPTATEVTSWSQSYTTPSLKFPTSEQMKSTTFSEWG